MNQFFVASKALIEQDGKILLLRDSGLSAGHAHNRGWWSMPGGRIRFEEDLIDGLIRETKEELGCESIVLDSSPVACTSWFFENDSHEKARVVGLFYRVTYSGDIVLDEEHDTYRWVSLKESEELPIRPEIREVLSAYFENKT